MVPLISSISTYSAPSLDSRVAFIELGVMLEVFAAEAARVSVSAAMGVGCGVFERGWEEKRRIEDAWRDLWIGLVLGLGGNMRRMEFREEIILGLVAGFGKSRKSIELVGW